jgi:hypothetical protein
MKIYHACDLFGNDSRHQKARQSWVALWPKGLIPCYSHMPYRRSAKDVGDTRALPFLKDVLSKAVAKTESQDDIVLWCNDDVILLEEIMDWLPSIDRAVGMRRDDDHIGRELFAFRAGWLADNWDEIPDFILGCPVFDLVLAAIIRKAHGFDSTLENMARDLHPADAVVRYALHEPHSSGWAGKNEFKFAGNAHNRKLAKLWCRKNMPTLAL